MISCQSDAWNFWRLVVLCWDACYNSPCLWSSFYFKVLFGESWSANFLTGVPLEDCRELAWRWYICYSYYCTWYVNVCHATWFAVWLEAWTDRIEGSWVRIKTELTIHDTLGIILQWSSSRNLAVDRPGNSLGDGGVVALLAPAAGTLRSLTASGGLQLDFPNVKKSTSRSLIFWVLDLRQAFVCQVVSRPQVEWRFCPWAPMISQRLAWKPWQMPSPVVACWVPKLYSWWGGENGVLTWQGDA